MTETMQLIIAFSLLLSGGGITAAFMEAKKCHMIEYLLHIGDKDNQNEKH